MSDDDGWVTYTIKVKRGQQIAPGVWTAVDKAEERQFIMIAEVARALSDDSDTVTP